VIELIHTATLVHDDATVTAEEVFSINALWKNKIAVLLFIIKGLLLSIDNGDFDLLKIISIAVREMSEGEYYR
jgi:octaprenyl-diphosphate synthase